MADSPEEKPPARPPLPPFADPLPHEPLSGDIDMFLRGAIALLSTSQQARSEIRERAKVDYGGLLDAHLITMSLIMRAVQRSHLNPGTTSASTSERLTLFASFIQGVDLAETAVSEGLYFQAAALIKQQMETVAAMNELAKGQRRDKQTPNVTHLLWRLNVHYGRIQGAAHVSNSALLHDFYQAEAQGEAVPVSILPRYSKSAARYLHTLEVAVMLQFALAVGDLFQDMYGDRWNEEELRWIVQVVDLLESEGAFDDGEPRSLKSDGLVDRPVGT